MAASAVAQMSQSNRATAPEYITLGRFQTKPAKCKHIHPLAYLRHSLPVFNADL